MLTLDDALARSRVYQPAIETEVVPLSAAVHRILAEDIIASAPVPPHASSAMDGYAFRHADLAFGRQKKVAATVAAGHPMKEPVPENSTVRIFTGAQLPDWADTVAIQEDCVAENGLVFLPERVEPFANCRAAGDDISAGQAVLGTGSRLRPQDIGIVAATGRNEMLVYRTLRVGIVATGDELIPPGEPLFRGCIYDTNRHCIAAAVRTLGGDVTDYGIVKDDPSLIEAVMARAAAENDLVITSGGMSAGDEDHVRGAVERLGRLEFWKIAMKPGKPLAVGWVKDVPFIGLPGNPAAAMITFWLIARPIALRLMGQRDVDASWLPVRADFAHRKSAGRREFLRARIDHGEDGSLLASVYHSNSSAMQMSLVWAHGLVEVPEDRTTIDPGDCLRYFPFETFGG